MDKIFLKIKEYKYSIVLIFFWFVLSLLLRASLKGFDFGGLFFATLNALFVYSSIYIFSKTFLRLPVAILLSALTAFECGLLYIYGNPLNYGAVESIMQTNTEEAFGLIKSAIPIGLLVFGVFLYLIIKSSREIKKVRLRNVGIILASYMVGFIIMPVYLTVRSGLESFDWILEDAKMQKYTLLFTVNQIKYPFIVGDALIMMAYFEQLSIFEKESKAIKKKPDGIEYADQSNIDKIILVLGESSLSDHYSLYGYPLVTTPFLDSLSINDSSFYYCKNVISPASYTLEALRLSLSFSTSSDYKPFWENKNIINLAKDAGFETSWVSNQPQFGSSNSFISHIASNAETVTHEFKQGLNNEDVASDLNLVPRIKSLLKSNKKQFMIVHLYGSHITYENRCDEADTKALGTVGKTIDYDKTIHHTDRVLRNIYELIKGRDENVMMYYYSDHGEVIGKGHGFLNKYKVQYRIPFVVIQNKPFCDVEGIINKYVDSQTQRLNTTNSVYILSEFLGYSVHDSLRQKALKETNYVFQPDKTRILYDKVID